MDDFASERAIWKEIEQSESYLVCCMFEEAALLASSVLKRVCSDKSTETKEDIQLQEIIESAGMVLVQSWKGLGRASKILDELKELFTSVTDIPVSVLLASVCFQLAEGSSFGVQEFLEAFLNKWRYVDEQYYVLAGAEADIRNMVGCYGRFVLGVDKYLEVVEVYVFTLLGMVLNDIDLAVSWVENAALPEDQRQQLLRRLHSLYSLKVSNPSKGCSSPLPADEHKACSSLNELNVSKRSPKVLNAQCPPDGGNNAEHRVLKLSRRFDPYFWWFRTITLKLGSARLVISNRKVMLGCLIFIISFVIRRKQITLKRIARKQVVSVKKALKDLWQLAFQYQVNPLAAVQPHPVMTHGSR
ncbi:protein APEM9 [Malania oleifera]|uniref:protein APEM9 n=1 Tax=Malania oleifera TaxID=397392 RepID=UPI0025ADE717|nr:protein APEM9 [Malania oleifera]